jgi:hypothetical protein
MACASAISATLRGKFVRSAAQSRKVRTETVRGDIPVTHALQQHQQRRFRERPAIATTGKHVVAVPDVMHLLQQRERGIGEWHGTVMRNRCDGERGVLVENLSIWLADNGSLKIPALIASKALVCAGSSSQSSSASRFTAAQAGFSARANPANVRAPAGMHNAGMRPLSVRRLTRLWLFLTALNPVLWRIRGFPVSSNVPIREVLRHGAHTMNDSGSRSAIA